MVVISYLGGKNVKIKIKPSKFDKKNSYKKKVWPKIYLSHLTLLSFNWIFKSFKFTQLKSLYQILLNVMVKCSKKFFFKFIKIKKFN